MPKRPIQDIVPGGSRSIRNIPIPETRAREAAKPVRPAVKPAPSAAPVARPAPTPEQPRIAMADIASIDRDVRPSPDRETLQSVRREFEARSEERVARAKRSKKPLFLTLGFVGAVALAWFISGVFHSATITVAVKSADVSLNEAVTASKGSSASASLPYNAMTVSTIGTQKVAAAGEEKVDKAATGVIIIYNNYNENAQRLVKNTRFETPEGLIFRITDSVTVPGKKGGVPGSVEATVVAEATGDKYNVGLKDFTIPGFKNDPRYTTFYARSKTPLAGGFTGTVKVVADADRLKAQNDIRANATASLLKRVEAEKPAGSVFFSNAYSISCTPLPQETISEREAMIKMECSLSAALFKMQDLAAFVARKHVAGYGNDAVKIANLSGLSFTPKAGFAPGSSDAVSFTLTGDATIEWTYDADALKSALAGKRRAEVPSVLASYPMIERADISVRPAWKRSLPENPADISIAKAIDAR